MKKVFVLDTNVLLLNADAISSFSDNIVVDEAQNLTPHEVKITISRGGEGTKIVLTDYPYQDRQPLPRLTQQRAGLSVVRLKDHQIHGHVTLIKSERSTMAGIAAEYL